MVLGIFSSVYVLTDSCLAIFDQTQLCELHCFLAFRNLSLFQFEFPSIFNFGFCSADSMAVHNKQGEQEAE